MSMPKVSSFVVVSFLIVVVAYPFLSRANPGGSTAGQNVQVSPEPAPANGTATSKSGQVAPANIGIIVRPYQVQVDVPKMLTDLKSTDPKVRQKAASQAASIGVRAKEAVPALAVMLEDKDEGSRQTAAYALHQIGPDSKDALPALIKALNGDRAIRGMIISTIATMGPEGKAAVPALLERFDDADENIRLQAATALHSVGTNDKECRAALVRLLDSSQQHVREGAAYQLGSYRSSAKDAVPALLVVLDDQSSYGYVRVAAAHALGQIDPKQPEVKAALVKAQYDKRKGVQKAAAAALKNSQ